MPDVHSSTAGRPVDLGQPEGEEHRRALVDVDVHGDSVVIGKHQGQRCRSRPQDNHGIGRAPPGLASSTGNVNAVLASEVIG